MKFFKLTQNSWEVGDSDFKALKFVGDMVDGYMLIEVSVLNYKNIDQSIGFLINRLKSLMGPAGTICVDISENAILAIEELKKNGLEIIDNIIQKNKMITLCTVNKQIQISLLSVIKILKKIYKDGHFVMINIDNEKIGFYPTDSNKIKINKVKDRCICVYNIKNCLLESMSRKIKETIERIKNESGKSGKELSVLG